MTSSGTPMDRAAWLAQRRRNQVERFDTRFAVDFDEHWGAVSATHARMIERFLARCPPGCEVLDAACGTGKYWPTIVASGRRPTGIDQSAEMLRQAAAKYPDVPTARLALTDLDAVDRYDALVCIDAMEYVPPEEWPLVLGAFQRALRAGGHLYLTVEQADPATLEAEERWARQRGHPVVDGEIVGDAGSEDDGAYHFYPSIERVLAWLDEAGFAVVDRAVGDSYLHLVARRA